MRSISFILVIVLLIGCSTARQTQEAINSGNYLSAINKSITKLTQNKTRKGNQDIVLLLEEAFKKHAEREINEINFLRKDGNSANLEKIYNGYLNLTAIQERIKPLLPLRIYDEGRNANFRQLRDDQASGNPVFGGRYWFARGTNYFLNVYFRF